MTRLAIFSCLCVLLGIERPVHAQTCMTQDRETGAALPIEVSLNWQFRASSPISGPPALTPRGQAYVATHEGYLHAIAASGAFLWSYTVQGALLNGLTVDPRGRVFASSSQGVVYGIRPSGAPLWVFHSPVNFTMPLAASPRGILFGVRDKRLYGLSTRRGLLWGANLGATVVAGPLVDPAGRAWLITEDHQLHAVRKPFGRKKMPLPAARRHELVRVTARGALVLSGDELRFFSSDGRLLWSRAPISGAGAGPGEMTVATLASPRRLVLLDEAGNTRKRWSHDVEISASPLGHGSWVMLPGVDGQLRLLSASGLTTCRIGYAPLFTPVARGNTVWVSAGDGSVASFHLPTRRATSASRQRGKRR